MTWSGRLGRDSALGDLQGRFGPRNRREALMGRLDGEIVLITGGASGLGRGIVERFVEEGARLAVLDRSAERLAALAAAFPGRVETIAGDVRSIADNQRAVDACVARFGRLDCAIG